MFMGVQRMPPDAAADGEASETRNGGRDLQPVVELVLTGAHAEDDTAGGPPAALGGRGDRDRVVVVVEALYPHTAGTTPRSCRYSMTCTVRSGRSVTS